MGTHKNDQDGVDRDDAKAGVHENVRDSEVGSEKELADDGRDPATGLIGNGQGVDPRYISQR